MTLNDNKRHVPLCISTVGDAELAAVSDVLRSGWLAHGKKNAEFEEAFCKLIKVRHAISLNSCTSGIQLGLEAMGVIGEVIVPSFSFVATANAVVTAGATPVFADIDPETRCISPDSIEALVSPQTEAIIPVHYGGLPADMESIKALADRNGLRIIEDSAECLGSTCHGRIAGSYDVGCFSFFPTKNITTGEGGMLTTNDDDIALRVRTLAAHGINTTTHAREKTERPWHRSASAAGYNFRMSNVLAAIGTEQMKKLERTLKRRREIAAYYNKRLSNIDGLVTPITPGGFTHSWQMYTITVHQSIRNDFLSFLRDRGVEASVHFDPPIHEQQPYRNARRDGGLEHTGVVARSIVTLPMYPAMQTADIEWVCESILAFPGLSRL